MEKNTEKSADKLDKAGKFQKVAEAIFRVLLQRGPGELSHSQISSQSGVSRAWLYKYIGKSREELAQFSLDLIGKQFARMENLLNQNDPDETTLSLTHGTLTMLQDAGASPEVMQLYYRYAGTQSVVGEKIKDIEESYIKSLVLRLERNYKIAAPQSKTIAHVLHGIRMGLCHRFAVLGLKDTATKEQIFLAFEQIWNKVLFPLEKK